MAVSGNELASLDFSNLIGGPLNAVVEAQAKSAIATANFIQEVGFDAEGKVINLDFTYDKTNADGRKQAFHLKVPLISMLPIPYIQIDEATVEFNASLTSQTSSTTDASLDTSGGSKASMWFGSVRMNAKASTQKKTENSDAEERSFDMNIKVTATGAEMPEGTSRILNMLEESLKENPQKTAPIDAEVTSVSGKILALDTSFFSAIEVGMPVSFVDESATDSTGGVAIGITSVQAAADNVNTITLSGLTPVASDGEYTITILSAAGVAIFTDILGTLAGAAFEKNSGNWTEEIPADATVTLTSTDASGSEVYSKIAAILDDNSIELESSAGFTDTVGKTIHID